MKYLLFIALLFTSCETGLKSGVVIDKWREAPHNKTVTRYNVVSKRPMAQTVYVDEQFALVVKGYDGEDTIVQKVYVPKAQYQKAKIGGAYTCQP
jgi:hypothetical protein